MIASRLLAAQMLVLASCATPPSQPLHPTAPPVTTPRPSLDFPVEAEIAAAAPITEFTRATRFGPIRSGSVLANSDCLYLMTEPEPGSITVRPQRIPLESGTAVAIGLPTEACRRGALRGTTVVMAEEIRLLNQGLHIMGNTASARYLCYLQHDRAGLCRRF